MIKLTGNTIVLRPVEESELHRLLRIYQGTPLYFEALGIDEVTLDDVRAQFAAAAGTEGRLLLGVEVPAVDLLIGVLDVQLGHPQAGAATVWLLLIWGGFQRQGYGSECLELLVDWLNQRGGLSELRVVAAGNAEGLRFWEQHGFTPDRRPAVAPFRGAPAIWLTQEPDPDE